MIQGLWPQIARCSIETKTVEMGAMLPDVSLYLVSMGLHLSMEKRLGLNTSVQIYIDIYIYIEIWREREIER